MAVTVPVLASRDLKISNDPKRRKVGARRETTVQRSCNGDMLCRIIKFIYIIVHIGCAHIHSSCRDEFHTETPGTV